MYRRRSVRRTGNTRFSRRQTRLINANPRAQERGPKAAIPGRGGAGAAQLSVAGLCRQPGPDKRRQLGGAAVGGGTGGNAAFLQFVLFLHRGIFYN